MEQKPLLIVVNNHAMSFDAVIDRIEFEKFTGEILQTFTESSTVEVMKRAGGSNRKCIILTESLVPSEHTTDSDRSAGTQEMIKQLRLINPECKIIVFTTDFWNLEKKFTNKEVDFVDAVERKAFNMVCSKIHQYSKVS